MKKIFGLGNKKGESPLGFSTSTRKNSAAAGQENDRRVNSLPGYDIRDRDLGKIHKAASVGDVSKVQQILLLGKSGLNDRDKRKRTALHLACANGHHEVVTLLAERKCDLNLYDSENRTALMKAVQCQKEECAAILLEHGADPNLADFHGNTALHYAVCDQRISIAAKLLLHKANTEARNKEGLTPLLLAIKENKQPMVEFLVQKGANIRGVDKVKSDCRLISKYKEDQQLKDSSQNSNPENESSEDDSLSRLSDKPGPDDSWPSSIDDLDFDTENVPKPDLTKLISASRQSMKILEAKHDLQKLEDRTLLESMSENLPQKYVGHLSGAEDQRGKNIVNGQVEDVFYIPSCMSGSRNLKMAKLEDRRYVGIPLAHMESPEKYPYLKPTVEMRDSVPNKAVGVEDIQTSRSGLSAELDLEMMAEEVQERLDENENEQPQVDEERKKHKSNEMEVSENLYDGATDDDNDDG
ncbi:PREDICTED: ankyrin repeat domain-containing protein 26-like, partial [Galeopterus variegatus]|uniref:Ankyrin repeat domain-containing protein 26-like n=1 Tax=Galeopterus variegatus TaxID=482537 RepID=A0ABM0RAP8_GALVR